MTETSPVIKRAGALAQRFEELLKSSSSDEQFLREVATHSAGGLESPWEVLAAVDQLYRRGKLSASLFRAARIGIERRALGLQDATQGNDTSQRPFAAAVGANVMPLRSVVPGRTAAARETGDTARAEQEIRQLRAELEQSRREAETYRQRLEQLAWAASLAAREPSATHASLPAVLPAAGTAFEPIPADGRAVVVAQRIEPVTSARALVLATPQPALRLPRRSMWLVRPLLLAGGLALLLCLPKTYHAPPAPVAVAVPPDPVHVAGGAVAPEPRPGVLGLDADRYVAASGDRHVTIGVRRSGGSDGAVSVQWRISASSAHRGRDYGGATRGRLLLPAGVDRAEIAIPLLRNPERRHTEFFDVRLVQAGGGARLDEPQRATVFLMPAARTPRTVN